MQAVLQSHLIVMREVEIDSAPANGFSECDSKAVTLENRRRQMGRSVAGVRCAAKLRGLRAPRGHSRGALRTER